MPSISNRAIVASAGAGKTTTLVDEALKVPGKRVLLTTYTNENVAQIRQDLVERHGCIPSNISVVSWHTFLLREGVRPYQNYLLTEKRVRSVFYPKERRPFHRKNDYLTAQRDIYGDKLAEFVFECNKSSGGRIVARLGRIYDYVLIDELQDLSGYDLNVLRELFLSKIVVVVVGDPRQATYSTNRAAKNRKYKGEGVFDWLKEREAAGEVNIEVHSISHRCNQLILDIADSLYPGLPSTTSGNEELTGHDGVFAITPAEVKEYVRSHNPVSLRYDVKADTLFVRALNIGITKGRTYKRVLIFPTKPMVSFLATGNPEEAGDKSRLYVAITRAKYSATFVVKDPRSLHWLNKHRERQ